MEINNNQLLRFTTAGSVDDGKSTLIGTLTTGELDNGKGSNRTKITKYIHEAKSVTCQPSAPIQWVLTKMVASSRPVLATLRLRLSKRLIILSRSWISLVSDDGARLLVDGNVVIDNWGVHERRSRGAQVQLQPGRVHLRVEYFDERGPAMVALAASFDGEPPAAIPVRMLESPGENAQDPCSSR